jgi:hypothetical protein
VLLWWRRVPLRSPLPNKDLLLAKVTDSLSLSLSLLYFPFMEGSQYSYSSSC